MSGRVYGAIEAGGSRFVCAAGYGPTEFSEGFHVTIPTSTPAATLASVVAFFAAPSSSIPTSMQTRWVGQHRGQRCAAKRSTLESGLSGQRADGPRVSR
jgi:hypothetical protein